VIPGILKLLVEAKNLFRAVVIGNRHHNAISQTNSWGLVLELSKCRGKVVFRIMEFELTIRPKQIAGDFEKLL
jgi:hypothetical protein